MKQIGHEEHALRAGDWIVLQGVKHEVAHVERSESLLLVKTTRGDLFRLPVSSASDCLYSRVEDRHSDTALNLRVQEVMLMSQIQIHQQIGDSEEEMRVRAEMVNTLAEVRRRMAHRRQRISPAMPLFISQDQS